MIVVCFKDRNSMLRGLFQNIPYVDKITLTHVHF